MVITNIRDPDSTGVSFVTQKKKIFSEKSLTERVCGSFWGGGSLVSFEHIT